MFAELIRKAIISTLVFLVTIATAAAPPTFQITELFSNLDGSVQFIRLTETAGLSGQNHFADLTLTSTHNGVAKVFAFKSDLPLAIETAHASILVAAMPGPGLGLPFTFSPDFRNCCFPVDYRMAERFLATDGGTIDFAGVDQISYSSLPTDGAHALLRDGTVGAALLGRPRCLLPSGYCADEPQIARMAVAAVEYYNAVLGHYFVTASAPDLDTLDSGQMSGWQRTGFSFPVAASPTVVVPGTVLPELQPVCRFYLPPQDGDSHFLSASSDECAKVRARYPTFLLESDAAFYAALPDLMTGECPPAYYDYLSDIGYGWLPVFRLWNGRPDTNHRYTVDPTVRNAMIDSGYVSEGYGSAGVAFCVPIYE